MRKSLALILFLAPISLLAANTLDLEEFVSSEDIVKNARNYAKKLPKKMGYKGSKIWKVLIDYTAEKEDVELFNTFLARRPINPRRRTEYRNDLYQLLKQNPAFFVKSFDKFYDGNKECLVWFFNKKSYDLGNLDFSSFKGRRFRKIESGVSPSEKSRKACLKIRNQKIGQRSGAQN